ncbi:Uncharacterised protein [Mycobacteroides abscessus subsp. massiliense]|nr:Uncharacterised protein [Mycobacteroides abscessus subsp. massiliense]
MSDVLGVVAGPRHVFLAGLQGRTDRMQSLDEESVVAQLLQRGGAHTRHHPHRGNHVFRVGDLHAELGVVGPEGAHAERHHPHGASAHAAAVQLGHGRAHLGRVYPVVGGAGILFTLGADVGPRFHARDIRRVRQRQE